MAVMEGYDIPEELYYHEEHAWAKLEEGGNVRVGMNDFYQKLAGDTTYVDLPFEGDEVAQGEVCGKLQSALDAFRQLLSGVKSVAGTGNSRD